MIADSHAVLDIFIWILNLLSVGSDYFVLRNKLSVCVCLCMMISAWNVFTVVFVILLEHTFMHVVLT